MPRKYRDTYGLDLPSPHRYPILGGALHEPRRARNPAPRGGTRKARPDGWTPARRAVLLRAVASGLSMARACDQVGLSAASLSRLRARPHEAWFSDLIDEARGIAAMNAQRAEEARLGVLRDMALSLLSIPVVTGGRVVGHRTIINERLMLAALGVPGGRAPSLRAFAGFRPKRSMIL